jgi:hypothetical protein
MDQHKYLTHLIKFHASKTPGNKNGIGKAEVQYNDGKAFRFFEVHGPSEKFISRSEAEQIHYSNCKEFDRQVHLRAYCERICSSVPRWIEYKLSGMTTQDEAQRNLKSGGKPLRLAGPGCFDGCLYRGNSVRAKVLGNL